VPADEVVDRLERKYRALAEATKQCAAAHIVFIAEQPKTVWVLAAGRLGRNMLRPYKRRRRSLRRAGDARVTRAWARKNCPVGTIGRGGHGMPCPYGNLGGAVGKPRSVLGHYKQQGARFGKRPLQRRGLDRSIGIRSNTGVRPRRGIRLRRRH